VGDFALQWDGYDADLAIVDDDLLEDEGLQTSVMLSLFLDRRADVGDVLPSDDGDRRGWWGDAFLADGDRLGSRLWLLERSKLGPELARRAAELAREALEVFVTDGVAEKADVAAEVQNESLWYRVEIWRPQGEYEAHRFEHLWNGEARRGASSEEVSISYERVTEDGVARVTEGGIARVTE